MNPDLTYDNAIQLGLMAAADSAHKGWSLDHALIKHELEFRKSKKYEDWADVVWLFFAIQFRLLSDGEQDLFYSPADQLDSWIVNTGTALKSDTHVILIPQVSDDIDNDELQAALNERCSMLMYRLLDTGSMLNPAKAAGA